MGMEKVVLDKVAKVLKQERMAYFAYGTLFAECTAKQAAKIETMLIEKCMVGVIVSKVGDEFAFDLV